MVGAGGGSAPGLIAWQLNLQHETIHGHPTPNRFVNEAIGCWPLSLWLPFSIYRSTHLAPPSGRESDRSASKIRKATIGRRQGGRASGRIGRALAQAQSTLLGRMVLGPAWLMTRHFVRELGGAWRGKRGARAFVLLASPPMRVGADLGDRRLRYAVLGLSRRFRLSRHEPGDAALLRRASRRRRRRTSARRSSRTQEFSGRSSCSTICMWRITCAAACPGTSSRNSIASIGRP